MSLFEKSSVYEQPSVYNQGGGKAQIVVNGQVFETTTTTRGGLIFTDKNLDVTIYGVTSVYPNNTAAYKDEYGLLYKKSEIIAAAQTFLYDGWRFPTNTDWNAFVGNDYDWHHWQTTEKPGGLDLYGFKGLCAGTYDENQNQWHDFGENAFFLADYANVGMRGDNYGSWLFMMRNVADQYYASVRFCKDA